MSFIDMGGDKSFVNKQNTDGNTALHVAMMKYVSERIVELLICNGALVNLPNDKGKTPFQLACRGNTVVDFTLQYY